MKNLKFQLDRNSLQIINLSFIRPNIEEYGDELFDNCTQHDKKEKKT
jgi:hypothetical protein